MSMRRLAAVAVTLAVIVICCYGKLLDVYVDEEFLGEFEVLSNGGKLLFPEELVRKIAILENGYFVTPVGRIPESDEGFYDISPLGALVSEGKTGVRISLPYPVVLGVWLVATETGFKLSLRLSKPPVDFVAHKSLTTGSLLLKGVVCPQEGDIGWVSVSKSGFNTLIACVMPFSFWWDIRCLQNWFVVYFNRVREPEWEPLARGVWYAQVAERLSDGQTTVVHLLKVDVGKARVKVEVAGGGIGILKKTSEMAKDAIAGVNGSYFNSMGETVGLLVVDGTLFSTPVYDRTALVELRSGMYMVEPISWQGFLMLPEGVLTVDGINVRLPDFSLVVYTPLYRRQLVIREGQMAVVVEDGRVRDIIKEGKVEIPKRGFVIWSRGRKKDILFDRLNIGDSVGFRYVLFPAYSLRNAIGGGPLLVREGIPEITSEEERFGKHIAEGRAPRTAVATFPEEGVLIFAVVDGRSRASAGMTLSELADFLRKLGAKNALNFDGGGSSTMVIRGKVVNSPSDGRERAVANCFVILPKGE